MKLSKFVALLDELVEEVKAGSNVTMPEDPEIVFSLGKPTNNLFIRPQGAGVAGATDGTPRFFIDFKPVANPVADLKRMMSELLGKERTDEILKAALEKTKAAAEQPSTNSKVDA